MYLCNKSNGASFLKPHPMHAMSALRNCGRALSWY